MDVERISTLVALLMAELGFNLDDPGLKATPNRVARFWREFLDYDPGNVNTTFEQVTVDQMVIVSDIRVWSLCEHHLLPFWCDLHIAYIATDRVLGLSKFARIAHQAAHRLQVQERLVDDIANQVEQITGSKDVAVFGRGVHTCMVMRGIKTNGYMTTSVMRGAFRENHEARMEFMAAAGLMGLRPS